jgi:hypothetical protein
MTTPQPPTFELCSAEYSATLVPVPDGKSMIYVLAQGVHRTSGYEVLFRQSPKEVYPPEFSLWHHKPIAASDVLTPFAKFLTFPANGKVANIKIHDANGTHEIPVTGIGQAALIKAIKTVIGPKVKSPAATSQPCFGDACADRRELSVTLPPGGAYVATHYFTTADYPDDRSEPYETGPGEVSWARFSPAVVGTNSSGQQFVTAYYYNRSNRDRWVSLNVDYQ